MNNQALAQKRSDELAAQAASRTAKDQTSAAEANAAFEAIRTDQQMKRQASRETPDIVKGEEEERGKKHAKLVGIWTQAEGRLAGKRPQQTLRETIGSMVAVWRFLYFLLGFRLNLNRLIPMLSTL